MNDYVCGPQQAMDKVQKSDKSNYNVLSTEEVNSKDRRFVKKFYKPFTHFVTCKCERYPKYERSVLGGV
jgi:hypothetical protein